MKGYKKRDSLGGVSTVTFCATMGIAVIVVRQMWLRDAWWMWWKDVLWFVRGLKEWQVTIWLDVGLVVLWGIMTVILMGSSIYRERTGRKYSEDKEKYHLGFFEMMEFYENADDKRMKKEVLPKGNWRETDGIIFGKVEDRLVIRASEGVGNCALFGRPGDGKTTCQIIPSALRFEGGVLCIDIKGDVMHWTKDVRKIKVFAPNDGKISCHFDPFAGIREMNTTDRRLFIENLGLTMIPDEPGDNSKFFVDGGRDFWNGIALYLLNKDPEAGFMDIVNGILIGDPTSWIDKVDESDVYEAKIFLDSYKGSNEKNTAGQYKKLCDSVRPFTNGALPELLDGKGDAIVPEMLDKGWDIYIEIPQDKMKVYAPVTTIIVQSFMNYFMGRADSSSGVKLRPVLFLLDEFPQLNFNFDTLAVALATLRSKRVSLFMAQQSIAQLEGRYGDTACREIIDNCSYISVMSAQDPKSREYFQKLIGTRKELKVGTSENKGGNGKGSSGMNVQQVREYVYQPEDFGDLKDKVVVVMKGNYIEAEKCRCYE